MCFDKYIYICDLEAENKNNLFLATQLMVNSMQGWSFRSLERMATQKEDIKTDKAHIYFETGSDAPNGWEDRRSDWENVAKLIEDGLE